MGQQVETDSRPLPMIDMSGKTHHFAGMNSDYIERCSCGWTGPVWARHLDEPQGRCPMREAIERCAANEKGRFDPVAVAFCQGLLTMDR